MDLVTISAIGGGTAAIVGTGLVLARLVGAPLRRLARQNDEFREDWYGQPARPGREPQPGVMERLGGIERELRTNGGSTLRDAVNQLHTRLEDHLRSHQPPPAGQ